jgi:hypothetical protein
MCYLVLLHDLSTPGKLHLRPRYRWPPNIIITTTFPLTATVVLTSDIALAPRLNHAKLSTCQAGQSGSGAQTLLSKPETMENHKSPIRSASRRFMVTNTSLRKNCLEAVHPLHFQY